MDDAVVKPVATVATLLAAAAITRDEAFAWLAAAVLTADACTLLVSHKFSLSYGSSVLDSVADMFRGGQVDGFVDGSMMNAVTIATFMAMRTWEVDGNKDSTHAVMAALFALVVGFAVFQLHDGRVGGHQPRIKVAAGFLLGAAWGFGSYKLFAYEPEDE